MADPVSLAITAAMMAAQMALTMTQKISGPRLDDLNVSLADYGTVIPRFWGKRRFQTQIIWAEKLREKKKKSKTKGGKYSEYKYFGTWAVVIADQEIDGVTGIWLDKHKVYQMTGAGPIAGLISLIDPSYERGDIKLDKNKNLAIYLGTESQNADPRMEAWCEDKYGPNSCPAYRGVSYIVFKDVPLEKFGNRIPQVTVEAVSAKSNNYPFETATQNHITNESQFSSDYTTMYAASGGTMDVWDVPTRTKISSNIPTNAGAFAVSPSGTLIGLDTFFGQNIIAVSPTGGESILVPSDQVPEILSTVWSVNGTFWFTSAGSTTDAYTIGNGITGLEGVGVLPVGFDVDSYFGDLEGNVWAIGDDGSDIWLYNTTTLVGFSVTSTNTGTCYGMCNQSGQFVVYQGGDLLLIDPDTETVLDTGSVASSGYSAEAVMRAVPLGSASIWFGFSEYSTADLSLIRTESMANWTTPFSVTSGGILYDPINNALMVTPLFDQSTRYWFYLDRIGSNGVLLSDVIGDVSDWCGITDYNYTDLDQTVDGYSVTQGTGKDMIAPLLDIHDSDLFPHDFQVKGLKRGLSSGGTIETPDFVRDGDSPRYVVEITQDTDLPRKLTFNFADLDKDQQTNTVIAQRPLDTVDGVREQTIDLTTYALTVGTAQKLADRYFRRLWNGREKISVSLTAQNLALEPTSVRTLDLDGATRNARLTKLTLSQGALKTEWERDFGGLNNLGTGTGAEMEGRDPEVIYVPGPTRGFVLDIPLVRDADNNSNPLLYYAAGKYLASQAWPGATVYWGDPDGEDYSDFASVSASDSAVWGYTTDVLGDANPWLWDRGNSVNVNTYGVALTSSTEAAIDADPSINLAYLGGELLNFTTATLEGDGTYTLSGFKRGRRGTEWATGDHAANDEFVLVSSLFIEGMGLSDVGNTENFKAQTFGRDPEGAAVIRLEPFTGATLKPYAPASVKWVYDGTDLQGTIFRRTRAGGAWTGGAAIPLAENSENYEIDVEVGGEVVRTISSTSTSFTYTAAMAAADGVTLPTPPTVNVYQLSDAVGRGFALAA